MLENYTCHVKRFNVNNFKAGLLIQKSKLNNTLFKIAGLDYMDTILIRSLFQIALLAFVNYWQKNDYHFGLSKTQGLILIQAFCSGIMIFGSYNCLRFLPIGDAMTILFSSPLFTGNYSLFHML